MQPPLAHRLLIATAGLLVATAAGAEPDNRAVDNDEPPPAFDKLDIDGDNQISRDEAKLERQLFLHFDAFDTDTTNFLSPREYDKYKRY